MKEQRGGGLGQGCTGAGSLSGWAREGSRDENLNQTGCRGSSQLRAEVSPVSPEGMDTVDPNCSRLQRYRGSFP